MDGQVTFARPGSPWQRRSGARLAVLRLLEQRLELSQRKPSVSLGLSLGKAHDLLRSRLNRGLVKAGNLRRSVSKLACAHRLAPRGCA